METGLRAAEGAFIAAAGMAALFATFWDDAWHTDLGRDSAWIAPHVLLYGAVGVIGLVVAGWGLRELRMLRSLRALIGERQLMVSGVGGAAVLAAAPVDAWWHAAFGRDAVLWSPPHMLVVLAAAALATGVLAALAPASPRIVTVSLAGLLLGDLMVVVMEYDTDVPQFRGVFYLPALLAAGLLATWLTRRLVPAQRPVWQMVAVYAVARVVIAVGLAVLGRDTRPVLPVAVLGLAVADLGWRPPWLRYVAAAAGVSAMAWLASAMGLATEPADEVAVVALPVLAVFGITVATTFRSGRRLLAGGAVAVVLMTALFGPAPRAVAHDAGEGTAVRPVQLVGVSTGEHTVTLTAAIPGRDCDAVTPRDIAARRAGVTVTGPLRRIGVCRYSGHLQVPSGFRWFVYVDFQDAAGRLQAWLALQLLDDRGRSEAERELYRPVDARHSGGAEVSAGVGLYALGAALLMIACLLAASTAAGRDVPRALFLRGRDG